MKSDKKFKVKICFKNSKTCVDIRHTDNYKKFIKRLAPKNSFFWYQFDIYVIDNKTDELLLEINMERELRLLITKYSNRIFKIECFDATNTGNSYTTTIDGSEMSNIDVAVEIVNFITSLN